MSSKTPPSGPQFIHELNEHGQHRIAVLLSDGTNTSSPWAPVEQVICFYGIYANASPGSGLPPHLFRVKEVPCQVLAS